VKTLKIRVKLILNCPRAHAITYTNNLKEAKVKDSKLVVFNLMLQIT